MSTEFFGGIKVRVRIVGIFLGNSGPIEIAVPQQTPSPAQVLTSLSYASFHGSIPNCTGFIYYPYMPRVGSHQDLNQCLVRYAAPFTSTTTHRQYPAGVYGLNDHIGGGGVDLVWQYYIFDANGDRKVKTGFNTPFSDVPSDPNMRIKDGDLLIFRCVAIATGPLYSANAEARVEKLGAAIKAGEEAVQETEQ